MQALRENRRIVAIGGIVLILLCLIGVLAVRIFTSGGGEGPSPTTAPTEAADATVVVSPESEDEAAMEGEASPTATRVIGEGEMEAEATPVEEGGSFEPPAEEASPEPTPEPPTPTPMPTSTPTPAAVAATGEGDSSGAAFSPVSVAQVAANAPTENLLQNGDFEEGFDPQGVAQGWQSFRTAGALISFSAQTYEGLVKSGDQAQRITIAGSNEMDRYAGIYQQIEVIPDVTYTLHLNGHIRTPQGDVEETKYGHRIEYVLDYTGGTDWQAIPKEEWTELPWDEQKLMAPSAVYTTYSAEIPTPTDKLTLFVRAWHKWPVPYEVEYTFDSLSLTGPEPETVMAMLQEMPNVNQPQPAGTAEESQEGLVDGGLPVTGVDNSFDLTGDGRFWGAVVVLLLLTGGAVYQARRNT